MGGLVDHVLNRGVGRMPLCAEAADDAAFEQAPADRPGTLQIIPGAEG
jgi:hypothetical protein